MQQLNWMTRQEARSLHKARQSGFLVHRSSQKCLAEEWSQSCLQAGQPCLRVERSGGKAQVILSTSRGARPLSDEEQRRIRELLDSHGEVEPGALWPIVYRFGAYSQPLDPATAIPAATSLSRLLSSGLRA